MFGTIEVIDAYRQDMLQAADDHRRGRASGGAMTRPHRWVPSLRRR